jgi:hypothetical protein
LGRKNEKEVEKKDTEEKYEDADKKKMTIVMMILTQL